MTAAAAWAIFALRSAVTSTAVGDRLHANISASVAVIPAARLGKDDLECGTNRGVAMRVPVGGSFQYVPLTRGSKWMSLWNHGSGQYSS